MNVIEIRELVKIYRSPFLRKKIVGLDGLNLDVKEGEVYGLLGPNGAGKTTTIKLIVGLIKPTGGRIKVFGKTLTTQIKSRIGYLPENPHFYQYLTGYELLSLYAHLYGIRDKKRVYEVAEMVRIDYALSRRIRTYSKGMLQRIGVAQALLNNPDLIILDEPLSGLDPAGRKEIKDIIFSLKDQGKTVLFSSHILPDVEVICDRVGIIYKGRMVSVGVLSEIADMEIKGFEVQCRDLNEELMSKYRIKAKRGKDIYLFIESENELEEFLGKVINNGGKVFGIVPEKKTLEEYFIEQIGKV